jgi:hypothetical protein
MALVIYFAAFLVVIHTRLRLGWFAWQLMLGLAIHAASVIVAYQALNGFLYWYALGSFAVGWFMFFTLSTAVYVSVSARILRALGTRPGNSLAVAEVYRACIRKPFEERAEFLVAAGLAEKGPHGYRITSRGRQSARRVQLLRTVFAMDGAGMYADALKARRQGRGGQ